MIREDAIKTLKELWRETNDHWYEEVYNMAINALEADHKNENSSEKPNSCEHITEDGVTCAKYPACDDCPDNPSNKVKGSERLLKGKTEPQTDCQWK